MRDRLWFLAGASLFAARIASADFIVNDASDVDHGGCGIAPLPCSLRDALKESQGIDGWSIHFAIGTGPQTINLMSNLPDILDRGTMDGRTQPGYAGVPLIEIHRADAGNATHGVHLGSPPLLTNGGVAIKALVINHFNGTCADCGGIIMDNPGGNFIQICYIGTDATGMTADGNVVGILDNTLGGNTIGGSTPAFRNVISGNGAGINISGVPGYSAQNIITGNYIGTDVLGTGGVPNGLGIYVGGPYPGFTPGIRIGGPPGSGEGNVFAGNNGGTGTAIQMQYGQGNLVQGNYIGLDNTGLASLPLEGGIVLEGENTDIIVDNVISVGGDGILFEAGFGGPPTTTQTRVQRNYIGTDATGNRVLLAGAGSGINLAGAQFDTIGGSGIGEGNVIGGFVRGILAGSGINSDNVIQGNRIGIGVDGSPIPNTLAGIDLESSGNLGLSNTTVGGINPGEGNIIAFNGIRPPTGPAPNVPGVAVLNSDRNTIRGNSIYGNLGKGIDFSFPSSALPYPNDVGDADTGPPNKLQNFPLITLTTVGVPTTRIVGSLNGAASANYTIDFYASPSPVHPADFLQGQTWIGFLDKTTDSDGNVAFDVTFPIALDANTWITATATDQSGNTSEFSQRSLFAIAPTHGPGTAGNPFTLTGQLFQAGATVDFGGPNLLATNVVVTPPAQITGQTPALAPGALYDVTVTNPDTSTAVMPRAWVSDFLDVLSGSPQYPFVISLALDGVTAGCGGGNYCPGNDVTRAQMAVFLLKAKYGSWWTPPAPTGTLFGDVASDSFGAGWIEELYHEGITGGCSTNPLLYCPGASVKRQQMAVFLLKAEHGSSYLPPPCVGIFSDVTCPSLFADWIEQLSNENITGGCGAGIYCPTNNVTRGQMAVFLTKTFNLP